jgi:hypothetical protein
MKTLSVSIIPVNSFFVRFDTFQIEDILPVRLLVFAGELYIPYIELRSDLLYVAIERCGVDWYKMSFDVPKRDDVHALF